MSDACVGAAHTAVGGHSHGFIPHTGAYSIVQATGVSPTFTVVEVLAEAPAESRTVIPTVYVPAEEYECVNVVVCTNLSEANADEESPAAYTASSPHVML